MSIEVSSMTNEVVHYLSIQNHKRLFFLKNYGIARSHEAISNPEDFFLEPLLFVSVSHANLPITYSEHYRTDQKISASTLIAEFWSRQFLYGNIKGKPDRLVIDKRLDGVLYPNFFKWLDSLSIKYEFSKKRDHGRSALIDVP